MNFIPLGARVLVRTVEVATETRSGLIIPGEAREAPQEGTVLGVGPKVEAVKVGDVILYGKFSGTELKLDGVSYFLLNEEDIVGIKEIK